jgi:hypothetical protein
MDTNTISFSVHTSPLYACSFPIQSVAEYEFIEPVEEGSVDLVPWDGVTIIDLPIVDMALELEVKLALDPMADELVEGEVSLDLGLDLVDKATGSLELEDEEVEATTTLADLPVFEAESKVRLDLVSSSGLSIVTESDSLQIWLPSADNISDLVSGVRSSLSM